MLKISKQQKQSRFYWLIPLSCLVLTSLIFIVACNEDEIPDTLEMEMENPQPDPEPDPQPDPEPDPEPEIPCEGMFGLPNANTGLDESFCKPICECLSFESRTFTESELTTIKSWTPILPFEELTSNPYNEAPLESDSVICAIKIEDQANKLYSLSTYSDEAAANAAGAILTHHDACGLCSTLSDFEVYARDRDIGTAVKACALANFNTPFDTLVACIEALGFTRPCAQIWAYNTKNTRENCLVECFNNDPYHNEDGTLGACLQCDEEISGPIFKQVAGRTRRNTGLASSICRFCEEVRPVEHDYPF